MNRIDREHMKDFVLSIDSIDSLVLERDPQFLEYLFFHNVLDRFCWITKLHYSDRETVKRKRHRIDTSFQPFVRGNHTIGEAALRRNDESIRSHLEFLIKKGWHNELVRSDPLHPDYLQIGTQVSQWSGSGSGGFVAWNIVQSYYAFFEYMTCLISAYSPSTFIDGHRKLGRELNNHFIGMMNGTYLFYPFNLLSNTPRGYLPRHPDYCQYHYATYPRDPGRGVEDLENDVQLAFQIIGNGKRASIFDLLYQLRIWANYTGVDSLLKLTYGGYQAFLMKNLATVVYFVGGMAELAVIRRLGASTYLGMLWTFSRYYIKQA